MNYRHAYHAGNFADVLKHAVLALVVDYFKRKPAPFRVIDTHAGIGRYDLQAVEASKTLEWQGGIGRLMGPAADPMPGWAVALLASYLDVVRGENPEGQLRYYPGSSLLARRLLRPSDRLLATELHPADHAELARRFSHDPQTKVIALDGWLALKSFLPPKERRGIVLVDPPFEDRDEMRSIVRGLAAALHRFESGCYIVWYPIKDPAEVRKFHAALTAAIGRPALVCELLIRPADDVAILSGCGLVIVNPPWTLADDLKQILPFLVGRLAVAPGARHILKTIGAEPG